MNVAGQIVLELPPSACTIRTDTFRQLTGSDTADFLETRVLNPCTASRVLSVVYTTDKNGENSKFQRIR